MTEAQWLACKDARKMADAAVESPRASERTFRLYIAAFWGWQARRLPADQRMDLQGRVAAMGHWADTGRLPTSIRASRSENVIFFNRNARRAFLSTLESPASWEKKVPEAVAIQPILLRDIFGNPFRPVTFLPQWRTSTVLALAEAMYDSRDFSAMPILADALQDAGCDNVDILNHCRKSGEHVRGCFAVDLAPGKVMMKKPTPMTADEWDVSLAPRVMLPHVRERGSPRRLRLFTCACCRAVWDRITNEDCRRGIDMAEAFADEQATGAERKAAQGRVDATLDEGGKRDLLRLCVSWALTAPSRLSFAAEVASHNSRCVVKGPKLRRCQANLLRCVFGNPFRKTPAFQSAWRTSTVTTLAQTMYEARDFSAMPILADALQDAGCDDADVLDHCRGEGPHVRGCFVVDLALGKE